VEAETMPVLETLDNESSISTEDDTVLEKETPVEAIRPVPVVRKQRPRKVRNQGRQMALYADLRREEYEEFNKLLDTLTHVDDLEPIYIEQVRDAIFHADHPFLL